MRQYKSEEFTKEQLKDICAFEFKPTYHSVFDNKKLVDTAGFVPLQVRIKQFLISGEQAKLSSEMFDSDDWRYMYENVSDNTLEVGDDIEDVKDKLSVVLARQREILAKKVKLSQEANTHDEASDKKSEAVKETSDGSVRASDSE